MKRIAVMVAVALFALLGSAAADPQQDQQDEKQTKSEKDAKAAQQLHGRHANVGEEGVAQAGDQQGNIQARTPRKEFFRASGTPNGNRRRAAGNV